MKLILEIKLPDTGPQNVNWAIELASEDFPPDMETLKVGDKGADPYGNSWRVEETPVEFPTEDGLYEVITQIKSFTARRFLRLADKDTIIWTEVSGLVTTQNRTNEQFFERDFGKLVSWKKL